MRDAAATADRRRIRRAGLWVVLLFWSIQFVELSLVNFAEGGTRTLWMLLPRAIVLIAGVLLTMIVVEVAARSLHRPFRTRLIRTLAAALATCAALVTVNFWVFHHGFARQPGVPVNSTDFIYIAFTWSWFFLSIAAALLALSYSFDIREREVRLGQLERVAAEARLASLRYQLNPHFLFNTLNSIAALIGEGEGAAAELMVENLSDFLRATLAFDPQVDITLAHELELQLKYLAIEKVRFPTRLRTMCDIDPEVRDALVPALLTQPIVENGVRHSVARSTETVTLRMAARRVGDRLRITLEEDGKPNRRPATAGTGLGIANVRARLETRFGAGQSLVGGALPGGGYRTVIELPLRYGDED